MRYKPMLAYPVSDKPIDYSKPVFIQPKLDGVRCLIQYGKWQVIISRKGFPHEYKSFATWADANKHAQDSENKINK